jgi:hypothetical protein
MPPVSSTGKYSHSLHINGVLHPLLQNQIESVVLVSDDSDFGRALERVRASERRVVVVGERGSLNKVADVVYDWWDVHEGLAMSKDYRWVPLSCFFVGSFPTSLLGFQRFFRCIHFLFS